MRSQRKGQRLLNRVLFGSTALATGSIFYFTYIGSKFELDYKDTPTNNEIIDYVHHLRLGVYNTTFYLPLRFMQIIYGNAIDKRAYMRYSRDIVIAPDGENLAVDWGTIHAKFEDDEAKDEMPIVLILPGITGSSKSSYVKTVGNSFRKAGFRPVVFNFRGTLLPQITDKLFDYRYIKEDLKVVVEHVREKYPKSNIYFAGFSLGSSIGIQYLAENPGVIKAMSCVANPFDVYKAGQSVEQISNRIYS